MEFQEKRLSSSAHHPRHVISKSCTHTHMGIFWAQFQKCARDSCGLAVFGQHIFPSLFLISASVKWEHWAAPGLFQPPRLSLWTPCDMVAVCPGLPEMILVYIDFLNGTVSSTSFHSQKSPSVCDKAHGPRFGPWPARISGSQHLHFPATTWELSGQTPRWGRGLKPVIKVPSVPPSLQERILCPPSLQLNISQGNS